MTSSVHVDVITAEVIRNAAVTAAQEMTTTLIRTAHNPLLYDVQDFAVGIVSPAGDTWAEGSGMAVFAGALPFTVQSGVEQHGADGFAEGDVLIANDPYTTGNHLSDTSIYMPIFADGELLAFAASTAHWADVGGKTPGGWCPDSVEVYQEGICFTHEKLVAAGVPNDALWSFIRHNTRFPDLVIGDVHAQIASCRQGAERMQTLCAKYGVQAVRDAMALAIERTEQDARRRIREIPDGTYSVSQMMDEDGVITGVPFEVALQLTVDGGTIRVSFDGSSPVRPGPVNAPEYATRSSVRAAIKGVISPTEPANAGDARAIEFDLPPGLVVSPERPAPVDSYGYMCIAVWELTMRALAKAVPERCVAGSGTLCMPTIVRVNPRDGRPFIVIDPVDLGNGARPDDDGPTMAVNIMGDVPNSPVEVIEQRYPIRMETFALRPESAGHGRFRGGAGVRRDYRVLEGGVMLQWSSENTKETIAKGAEDGHDGLPAEVHVIGADGSEVVLDRRVTAFGPLEAGDIVSVRSGGGGGWGDPVTRDGDRVAADVRDGLISAGQAQDIYGHAAVGAT
jgi:N-methylhydantoinase B